MTILHCSLPDPQTPSTLGTYLSDYESLAEVAQLTLGECLTQSTHYLAKEDKEDLETSLNSMPHLWIGTHSRKLSLGSV